MIYQQTNVLINISFILMSVEVQALSTIHTNVCSACDKIKPIKNRFVFFFQQAEKNSDSFSESDAELTVKPR